MTMISKEEGSSKMKFLVPIVVLLLCGVALTGAAYAYSSSMDATATAKVDSYEITLGDDANVITHEFDCLEFSSKVGATTTYTLTGNSVQTITVKMVKANHTSGFTIDSMPTVTLKDQNGNAITKIICTATCSDASTGAASHVITFTFALANGVTSLAADEVPSSITATFSLATTGVEATA